MLCVKFIYWVFISVLLNVSEEGCFPSELFSQGSPNLPGGGGGDHPCSGMVWESVLSGLGAGVSSCSTKLLVMN